MTRQKVKKKPSLRDDIIGWAGLGVVGVVAIILDRHGTPGKWHAAIEWTGTALYGLVVFGRSQWRVWGFWLFCATCFLIHLLVMWIIFARLLPTMRIGTLYVIPLGFIESIVLLGMFGRLEQTFGHTSLQSKVD